MSFHLNPWYWITLAGTPEIWLGVAAGMVFLYLIYKRFRIAKPFLKVFLLSLVLVFIIFLTVKDVTQVPRPCDMENPYCETSYSFPSAHSGTAFVFFTALFLFKRRHYWLFIIPAAVAASRVALGVHTVTDVVVGSILGISVTAGVWWLLKRKQAL